MGKPLHFKGSPFHRVRALFLHFRPLDPLFSPPFTTEDPDFAVFPTLS